MRQLVSTINSDSYQCPFLLLNTVWSASCWLACSRALEAGASFAGSSQQYNTMQLAAVQQCKLQPASLKSFMALSVPFYTRKCFCSATPGMSSWQQPMFLRGCRLLPDFLFFSILFFFSPARFSFLFSSFFLFCCQVLILLSRCAAAVE